MRSTSVLGGFDDLFRVFAKLLKVWRGNAVFISKLDRQPDVEISIFVPDQHLPRLGLLAVERFMQVQHGRLSVLGFLLSGLFGSAPFFAFNY